VLSGPQAQPAGDKAEFIEKVRRALYLGKIVSYAQGFSQLRAASDEYNWDLNYGEIAKIFRAGCIIRAQFLQKITDAYAQNAGIANLCWRRTSNRSLMTISRRCVMSWLMPCRMVFRYRRSLPQLPTTTATVPQFCQLT
jgi:6-phosphogluconate dehydrogenase